jgi:hypothetical protein
MEVIRLERSTPRLPRVESVLYRLAESGSITRKQIAEATERYRAGTVENGTHRDKPLNLYSEALEVLEDGRGLKMRLRTLPSGSTVSPYAAFALLLGVEPESLRSEPLSKEDFAFIESPVSLETESA